ncbi:MAG TPA: glutamine amidotransferase [Alloacidobacterium sp.]|nr:glutamine amidotransferase [Alloacidobacterium sp.]
MKSAVAIRHVHFEGLGSLAFVLMELGYNITYLDVGKDDFSSLNVLEPDLLVMLGAPVGVYEEDQYPFLVTERNLLAKRLQANLPTLGICLGAQQIAYTLGANVAFSGHKEIGFAPVELTAEGRAGLLRHLEAVAVLHWHGDMFEIPAGALRLAGTALCRNQAFSLGRNVLGLQFHPEVDDAHALEAWLVGHASELASAKIDPRAIREDAKRCIAPLRVAAQKLFKEWLEQLE